MYTLIIALIALSKNASADHVAVTTTDFNSKNNCEYAKAQLIANVKTMGTIICVPK